MPASSMPAGDARHELGVAQLGGGEVDVHQQPADLGRALPALELGEGARLDELADRHDQPGALGERDELGGRDVLGALAVPARERLGADDAAGRQLHDRLVGDLEAALLDGALELAGERVAAQQRGGLAVVEDLEVALLLLLGGVHGDVGVAQHLGGGRLAVLAERDAGAGADPQRGGRELERLLERELDALGDAGGALVVAAVEQDRELVAAEPRGQVARAQAGAQPAGEGHQQLVADLVPEAVVDALEVVEVEEQHDGAAVGAASAASTCWVNSARLARPVSGSWWARCSSRSRSSVSSPTACSSRSCSSETAVWLASVSSSVRSAEVNSVTRPSRLASAIAPSSACSPDSGASSSSRRSVSRIHDAEHGSGRGLGVQQARAVVLDRAAQRAGHRALVRLHDRDGAVERDRGPQCGAAVGGEEVDLGDLGVERRAGLGQQLGQRDRTVGARWTVRVTS